MTRLAIALGLAAACSGSTATTLADHSPPVAPATPAPVSSPAPHSIDLPGDANGIYWDAASSTLYLTDDTNDQILSWTDAAGFQPVGALPAASKVGLGGLVRLDDGTFVTTSFGFGTAGAVFTLAAGKQAATVPGLDPERRRIGIARGPDGTLYDAYFVVHPGTKHAGGVARLDLAGHETDLALGELAKPVGLAATATTLYISDQEARVVLAYTFATAAVTTIAKDLPSADLLSVLPNGDLVTGGKQGAVYRIDSAGKVTTIASGFEQVRGVAYDGAHHRLFVVEHSKTGHHKLDVLAVP